MSNGARKVADDLPRCTKSNTLHPSSTRTGTPGQTRRSSKKKDQLGDKNKKLRDDTNFIPLKHSASSVENLGKERRRSNRSSPKSINREERPKNRRKSRSGVTHATLSHSNRREKERKDSPISSNREKERESRSSNCSTSSKVKDKGSSSRSPRSYKKGNKDIESKSSGSTRNRTYGSSRIRRSTVNTGSSNNRNSFSSEDSIPSTGSTDSSPRRRDSNEQKDSKSKKEFGMKSAPSRWKKPINQSERKQKSLTPDVNKGRVGFSVIQEEDSTDSDISTKIYEESSFYQAKKAQEFKVSGMQRSSSTVTRRSSRDRSRSVGNIDDLKFISRPNKKMVNEEPISLKNRKKGNSSPLSSKKGSKSGIRPRRSMLNRTSTPPELKSSSDSNVHFQNRKKVPIWESIIKKQWEENTTGTLIDPGSEKRWNIEFGEKSEPLFVDTSKLVLEETDDDKNLYSIFFEGKPHENFYCQSEIFGPVVITIEGESTKKGDMPRFLGKSISKLSSTSPSMSIPNLASSPAMKRTHKRTKSNMTRKGSGQKDSSKAFSPRTEATSKMLGELRGTIATRSFDSKGTSGLLPTLKGSESTRSTDNLRAMNESTTENTTRLRCILRTKYGRTELYTEECGPTKKERLKAFKQAVVDRDPFPKKGVVEEFIELKFTKITLPDVEQRLHELEEKIMNPKRHKFGLLYAKAGQTEDEMFNNKKEDTSHAWRSFVERMGERIVLKDWTGYRGGLDVNTDTTGTHSIFTKVDKDNIPIMFHVSTLLPYFEDDSQQVERKRHLGNDIVVIVFLEKGDKEKQNVFDPTKMHTHFNQIYAAVKEYSTNNYHVEICVQGGIKPFRPVLDSTLVPKSKLRDWLLVKLVNGERAALRSSEFAFKLRTTRESFLKQLVDDVS